MVLSWRKGIVALQYLSSVLWHQFLSRSPTKGATLGTSKRSRKAYTKLIISIFTVSYGAVQESHLIVVCACPTHGVHLNSGTIHPEGARVMGIIEPPRHPELQRTLD